jgi:hypothetical protein
MQSMLCEEDEQDRLERYVNSVATLQDKVGRITAAQRESLHALQRMAAALRALVSECRP